MASSTSHLRETCALREDGTLATVPPLQWLTTQRDPRPSPTDWRDPMTLRRHQKAVLAATAVPTLLLAAACGSRL